MHFRLASNNNHVINGLIIVCKSKVLKSDS